jgi:hypothetical protein
MYHTNETLRNQARIRNTGQWHSSLWRLIGAGLAICLIWLVLGYSCMCVRDGKRPEIHWFRNMRTCEL